ncbi:MAG TPA: prepilin-type N-terminal cleavage/methylation domain-containing protein [Gallionellaceae bacterium]
MMLISAPGIYSRSRQTGFTLLELLVSLVVLSIAISLVALNLAPDDQAELHTEAERLALLLENANNEARISGRELAWSSTSAGYHFLRKNDYNDWVVIDDNSQFKPRSLSEHIRIGEVRLEEKVLKRDELLLFSTSALPLPFRIKMKTNSSTLEISGKSTGEVSILPPNQISSLGYHAFA